MTVVVPVLDDADQLRTCLAALAAQTRPADEVIVVDNGSSDGSADVALAAGATVLHEPVRAIGAAAARGYDAARGELIARIDSDTVVPADWIERAVAWFDDPMVAAVTGPGHFRGLGPLASLFWQAAYMRAYFLLMTAALARPPLFGSNMLLTAAVWRAVRGRVHRADPLVHDDVDLAFQLDPAWRTVLDRSLAVSVSGSPVRDASGLVLRVRKAYRTIRLAGVRGVPTLRFLRRLAAGPRTPPPILAPEPGPHVTDPDPEPSRPT
ncbi:glycosyltransferase family 2 protein [Curtobacterium sp. Leaf261]|uniref:glycosyltransferase family 2 protein n=1 Tax=Curtobacterium sp. Leaf261 TaxID=1736311 RepID=UPI001910E0E8|nr:glycosyltransferase family 2 protein [Curtobacterium sp. Leaf261]